MSRTLDEMIGYKAMLGMIKSPKGGVAEDAIPPGFMRVTRKIQGQTGTWKIVAGNRKTARLVHYGDPSVKIKAGVVSARSFTCMHTYEHETHDVSIIDALLSHTDTQLQQFGQEEVDRKTVEFRQRLNNWRVMQVYSMLALGKVHFDGDGNLLNSSSGAVNTIDAQIASSTIGNMTGTSDVLLAGSAAKWSAAGTNIPDQMRKLHEFAYETSGYGLDIAFYGKNVPGYLIANTAIGTLLNHNGAVRMAIELGQIPNGFLGVKEWRPVNRAFFENQDGTIKRVFGDATVVFAPTPSPEWWEVIEGTYRIPTDLGKVATDAVSLRSAFKQVHGMFSYCTIKDDPPGMKHFIK